MKRFATFSMCSLCFACVAAAAEPSANAQKAVAAAERDWTAAVLHADKGALDKLLAPDLSYTHSSAKTQTKEEFLKDVSSTTTYKSIEFENTKMLQYGSTVVVTHNGVFTTVQSGVSHLFITEVWAEVSGGWQMVSRQATKLP